MPSITFAAGHLQLLYYDQREDLSRVYSRFVDESQILGGPPPRVRHTTEVWAATATPGPSPLFTSVRVTDYLFGVTPGQSQLSQLQYDPPNLPLFRGGTTPFAGDYIDVFPSQPIVTIGSSSFFNTAPTVSPLFHAVWTDNRDVRPPADGDWTRYTPPVPSFPRPTVSGFDPALAIPVPDCEPGFVATRNQNVYTAQVSSGLIAAALTNAKQLGTIQRSFPIYAQNTTSVRRSYRISIRTQPVGGAASLQQFASLTSLDVSVPSRSSVARTVYVTSTDPRASVPIDVVEITAPGGGPIAGGQSAVIILNPDPTNPDVENPDVENPDVENPDVENPDVENVEVYNPDVENPAVLGLANPDVENPDVENPDVENTLVLNPAIVTPDVENPDVENPDVENPDVENPDVENLDLINGGLTDTTWTLTNRGNTAASYSLKMLLNRGFPVGFHSQLLVHRVYRTPAVQGCELKQQTQNILLVNLPDPSFTKLTATTAAQAAGSRLASAAASALEPGVEDPDIDNVTFAIPPGESIVVTLRVYDPNRTDAVTFDAAAAVTPAMIAQAVETEAVANGETTPEVAAPLLPEATPPAAPAGATYSYTLPSIGTGTWSVAGGALPTGLTLNPTTGEISGVATVGGTFSFVALFVRDDGLEDYQTVTITVAGASAFADLAVTTVPIAEPRHSRFADDLPDDREQCRSVSGQRRHADAVAAAQRHRAVGDTVARQLHGDVDRAMQSGDDRQRRVRDGDAEPDAWRVRLRADDGDRGERDWRRDRREQRRDRLDPDPGICAVCDADIARTVQLPCSGSCTRQRRLDGRGRQPRRQRRRDHVARQQRAHLCAARRRHGKLRAAVADRRPGRTLRACRRRLQRRRQPRHRRRLFFAGRSPSLLRQRRRHVRHARRTDPGLQRIRGGPWRFQQRRQRRSHRRRQWQRPTRLPGRPWRRHLRAD